MLNRTCPYCGGQGHVPFVTKGIKQRMFRAIWDSPGCDIHHVAKLAYGSRSRTIGFNTLQVHISQLRRLLRDTPYTLVDGRTESGYRIVHKDSKPHVKHRLPT